MLVLSRVTFDGHRLFTDTCFQMIPIFQSIRQIIGNSCKIPPDLKKLYRSKTKKSSRRFI